MATQASMRTAQQLQQDGWLPVNLPEHPDPMQRPIPGHILFLRPNESELVLINPDGTLEELFSAARQCAELRKQLDGMAELNELLRMARDTVGNTLSAQVTAAEEHTAFWKDRSQTWRGEWVDVSNALGERDKEIAYLRGEIARLQERLGEPVIDGRK